MKNIKYISIFILALTAFTFTSCNEDEEYKHNTGNGARIVGFESSTKSISHFVDIGASITDLPVVLIGGADGTTAKSDIKFNIEILTAKSTAIEGVEFEVDKTVTLLKGEEFVNLPLTVNTGSLDLNTPSKVVLKLSLQDQSDVSTVVSSATQELTVTFVGCKAIVEQSNYNNHSVVTDTNGAIININFANESITLFDGTPNLYITKSTLWWTNGALAPAPYDGFIFEVVCGEVFIKSQQLGNYWGNVVSSVDEDPTTPAGMVLANGNIEMEYKVCYAGACRFNKVTYTKI